MPSEFSKIPDHEGTIRIFNVAAKWSAPPDRKTSGQVTGGCEGLHGTGLESRSPRAKAQVLSLTVMDAPFAFTLAMPDSRDGSEAYIWLVPITWWLPAFRLKNAFPLEAVLRS